MSVVRYYSDPHFGHKNMAVRRGFKDEFEMDDHIVEQWNSVVGKKDVLLVLVNGAYGERIVKMATMNGAKQQGRADTGVIAQGKKADLIVIDMDKPHLYPWHDILSNLIFSAQGADVVLTMCDGRILYKNGIFTTLDIEKIYFGVKKSLDRIAKRLVSR